MNAIAGFSIGIVFMIGYFSSGILILWLFEKFLSRVMDTGEFLKAYMEVRKYKINNSKSE